MTIVGFNYTKIHVERKSSVKGKINIKNNVAIKKVEKSDLSLGGSGSAKQAGLKFMFEFTCIYDPKIGEISLAGEVFWLDKEENVKKILSGWKKNKKIQKEISVPILNTVLQKCNIQALMLSRDINLPPPIPLPKVNVGSTETYIG